MRRTPPRHRPATAAPDFATGWRSRRHWAAKGRRHRFRTAATGSKRPPAQHSQQSETRRRRRAPARFRLFPDQATPCPAPHAVISAASMERSGLRKGIWRACQPVDRAGKEATCLTDRKTTGCCALSGYLRSSAASTSFAASAPDQFAGPFMAATRHPCGSTSSVTGRPSASARSLSMLKAPIDASR